MQAFQDLISSPTDPSYDPPVALRSTHDGMEEQSSSKIPFPLPTSPFFALLDASKRSFLVNQWIVAQAERTCLAFLPLSSIPIDPTACILLLGDLDGIFCLLFILLKYNITIFLCALCLIWNFKIPYMISLTSVSHSSRYDQSTTDCDGLL